MITLYGASGGRASRSLLALEELGVPYRHVPLRPWDRPADAETLARINPNRRVPVLDDGGLVLTESMAINLYLGERYGAPPLWPDDAAARGRIYQWSVWGQTDVDVMARHRARYGKDPERKARAEAERLAALTIIDAALAGRPYLLGDTFTLADLNLASTLSEPWEKGLIDGQISGAETGLTNLAGWLGRCVARPSWAKVAALP